MNGLNGINSLTQATTANTDYSALQFMMIQAISKIETISLVEVISCTNNGELTEVGFVDVKPLVNMVDGAGNGYEHGILYRLPYFRLQGGKNAFIIDPKKGDLGIAVFSSRDISSVKSTKSNNNPDTYRRHDMSDGLYLGGFLNENPEQYIQFDNSQISIFSPNSIKLEAQQIIINCENLEINSTSSFECTSPSSIFNGNVIINGTINQGIGGGSGTSSFIGNMNVDGEVTANGKSLSIHIHSGVESGSSNTSPPV